MRESGGKRRMASVAEKRVALATKEATRKIGYTDVKACQLEVIAGLVSGRDVSAILVSAKQTRFELAIA